MLSSFRLSPYSAAGRAPYPVPTVPKEPSDVTPSITSSHSVHLPHVQAKLALALGKLRIIPARNDTSEDVTSGELSCIHLNV